MALVRPELSVSLITALAEGYARGVGGDEAFDVGEVLRALRVKVAQEGAADQRLREVTDAGRLRVDATLDDAGRGVLPLSGADRAQLERLAGCLPAGARVSEAARLFGKGVSSLPAIRYLLLVEVSGRPGLLELREVVDATPIPGLWVPPGALFGDQGDRMDSASDRLWRDPLADPWRNTCTDGGMSFKARSAGSAAAWGRTGGGLMRWLGVATTIVFWIGCSEAVRPVDSDLNTSTTEEDTGHTDPVDDTGPTGAMVINELVASNQSGARDESCDRDDWVELHNGTTDPIDLSGWTLVDDAGADPWSFPSGTRMDPWARSVDGAGVWREASPTFDAPNQ